MIMIPYAWYKMISLLIVLKKHVYMSMIAWYCITFCYETKIQVYKSKEIANPYKRRHLDCMLFKRDRVWEWIIIVMYDYPYYHDVWVSVEFQKTQPPKLAIQWQNLSTTVATQWLCQCRHSPLFHYGGGGITQCLSPKPEVMGGLCYNTLPMVCNVE